MSFADDYGGAYVWQRGLKFHHMAGVLRRWRQTASAMRLVGTTVNGGMSFSGKITQNGICYLFIVDGSPALIIRKYNLTKHSKRSKKPPVGSE